jgi:hypothetical protein
MSLLHRTDVYQDLEEKAARKHHEYGFALALICVALALVVASVMFFDAFRPNGPHHRCWFDCRSISDDDECEGSAYFAL